MIDVAIDGAALGFIYGTEVEMDDGKLDETADGASLGARVGDALV